MSIRVAPLGTLPLAVLAPAVTRRDRCRLRAAALAATAEGRTDDTASRRATPLAHENAATADRLMIRHVGMASCDRYAAAEHAAAAGDAPGCYVGRHDPDVG